jgi:hypothetical protein
MAKLSVTLEVGKESYELGKGLADFIVAVKQALADGWQPGADLPALIGATVGNLVPALQGVDQIKGEWDSDKMAVANAAFVTGSTVIGAFLE